MNIDEATINRLISQISSLEANVRMLCKKIDTHIEKFDKDHDELIKLTAGLNEVREDLKNHIKQHQLVFNTRLAMIVALIGALSGAFFSSVMSFIFK